MNLGVVTKSLEHYGGAQIYLLECLRRWQEVAEITLYANRVDERLLDEFGVDTSRLERVVLPDFGEEDRRFALVEDVLILPRMWEHELRPHDAYFLNGFPLHFTRCFPSVYFCHEPLRMLYDLRYQHMSEEDEASVHVYPEQKYRYIQVRQLEVELEIIEALDRNPTFDHLVVNSRAMARYAHSVYGREADLIAYPAVNPQPAMSEESMEKRAIYVGRLWWHKRVDLLIRAIARLEEGCLDIVGDGPERDSLAGLVGELDVEDRVVFHGSLPLEEVSALYERATCGAYVPVREPFGMMPLEAAAVGRPVVVTPEGGYNEILSPEAALIVPPTPQAIARAMDRLFTNPKLAKRMGARAREQVEEVTWDRTAADIFQLLQRAADRVTAAGAGPPRPLVGAFYYPWYDAGRPMRHWNENTTHAAVRDLPLRGVYTSYDPRTIQRHLDLAERACLDFLAVNWEIGPAGVHARDLEATRQLFEGAARHSSGLKLSLALSLHTSRPDVIRNALELGRELAKGPGWLKVRDRPVLWFSISSGFFGSYYDCKAELEELCGPFAVLATGAVVAPQHLPSDIQRFFAGWSLLVPFRVSEMKEWEDSWRSSYRNHTFLPGDPYRVFTISPGYDDRHLDSEDRLRTKPRFVDRGGVGTYETMIECAQSLDPAPEIITISSFNEFHETTQIEPSFEYGDVALEQTRAFIRELTARYQSK
jgi:glycosyltransferase involved in cell wall biosynthesis